MKLTKYILEIRVYQARTEDEMFSRRRWSEIEIPIDDALCKLIVCIELPIYPAIAAEDGPDLRQMPQIAAPS